MDTSRLADAVDTDLQYELNSATRVLQCFMSMNWSQLVDARLLIARVRCFYNVSMGNNLSLGLRGFRPGPTQTRLYIHMRWLEA